MFPITLHLKSKQIVIVGGGVVASRRIQPFLTEEAKVTVVSPSLNEPLQKLYTNGAFAWKKRAFHEGDVQDAFIIIAATNSREVNAHIGLCCHENQLINLVDDPKKSTFHFPATVQRGLLNIAVSTSGASPMLSGKIRDDIAEQFDEEFIEYISFVKDVRNKIINSGIQPLRKKLLLQELIEQPLQSVEEQEQFLSRL